MNARRVLLTTDVVGGVWDFCLVLAAALHAESAARVTLLALGEPSALQRGQAAQNHADLVSANVKLEWMQDADADVLRTKELVAQVARDSRADVLHANQFAAACARVEVPVVLTLHSDVLSWDRWTNHATDIAPRWHAYARLVGEALCTADETVAVSHFLADEVRATYQVQQPIHVIYNGWPAAQSPSGPVAERTTLLAGRIWDSAKNIDLAAEAAAGWDPGRVVLAGSQAQPDSGVLARIQPPLEALGYLPRSELDGWLRRAAIYLSPARYDPFGLLPLQAALNGCALLLSDIPSYRELWDGAACFFRSDDPIDLRRQWQTLLDSPDERAYLQSRALRRATERYTPARMLASYREVYARVERRVAA